MSERVARYGWNNLPGGNPGWKPGQSGNPKGRPKADQDLAALCRAQTAECVQTLIQTMRNKSHKDRITATMALLDRGWGKPRQQLEVSADADAIGLHLVAARAFVALAEAAEANAPPTIDANVQAFERSSVRTDAGQAEARARSLFALDAPKPSE